MKFILYYKRRENKIAMNTFKLKYKLFQKNKTIFIAKNINFDFVFLEQYLGINVLVTILFHLFIICYSFLV